MKILLSIKPEFAEKIFNGEKIFEYRSRIFKSKNVKKIILYASSPVKKVVGEIEIDKIISAEKYTLWKLTKQSSGISKEYFYRYFKGRNYAYAIKIKKAKKYKRPFFLKELYNINYAPQSFIYL